eukprot:1186250-Prorocentrum_minimum.AAC.7
MYALPNDDGVSPVLPLRCESMGLQLKVEGETKRDLQQKVEVERKKRKALAKAKEEMLNSREHNVESVRSTRLRARALFVPLPSRRHPYIESRARPSSADAQYYY